MGKVSPVLVAVLELTAASWFPAHLHLAHLTAVFSFLQKQQKPPTGAFGNIASYFKAPGAAGKAAGQGGKVQALCMLCDPVPPSHNMLIAPSPCRLRPLLREMEPWLEILLVRHCARKQACMLQMVHAAVHAAAN